MEGTALTREYLLDGGEHTMQAIYMKDSGDECDCFYLTLG